MKDARLLLGTVLTFMGVFWLIVGVVITIVLFGGVPVIPFLLLLGLGYGWVLWAFFHYRQCRQDEFLHLLAAAVDANAPLPAVLRAYLTDRPNGPLREFWVGCLLFFVLPGYYWIWYQRFNFNRKVARVAAILEMGYTLPTALAATPGVAPRQMILATEVGEATGRMDRCLRTSAMPRLAPVWLEILPRVFYPLLLLVFITGVGGFWMAFLLPRYLRIFQDFDGDFPEVTNSLVEYGQLLDDYAWVLVLAVPVILSWLAALISSPTLRWYHPLVARLYRRAIQGRVLKMLAALLEAGKPIPEALNLLANSDYFPLVARRRLDAVCTRVEQGEPLAESLRRGGLLPRAMVPLVGAAERVRNLPWALAELGDHLSNRLIRRLRRISVVVFPLILLAIGGLVGFIALGMFLPLVELITRLSE